MLHYVEGNRAREAESCCDLGSQDLSSMAESRPHNTQNSLWGLFTAYICWLTVVTVDALFPGRIFLPSLALPSLPSAAIFYPIFPAFPLLCPSLPLPSIHFPHMSSSYFPSLLFCPIPSWPRFQLALDLWSIHSLFVCVFVCLPVSLTTTCDDLDLESSFELWRSTVSRNFDENMSICITVLVSSMPKR